MADTGSLRPTGEYSSPIGPSPQYPEKHPTYYERKMAGNVPGQRGPLRFEEGVATDTDVPMDFQVGVAQGYMTSPGRFNRNAKVDTKWPDETVAQRAHVGSAAWVESPTFLGEFAHGTMTRLTERAYEMSVRDGMSYRRANPATVYD